MVFKVVLEPQSIALTASGVGVEVDEIAVTRCERAFAAFVRRGQQIARETIVERAGGRESQCTCRRSAHRRCALRE
jgi:hypothetical protein